MDDSSLTERQAVVRVPAGAEGLREAASGAAGVTVAGVGPTGVGGLDPLVTATSGGETAFYADPSAATVETVAAALADGTVGSGDPFAVVEHDPGTAALPVPDDTALAVGTRRLLAGAGWHRPTEPADYRAAGGFADADEGDVRDAAGGSGRDAADGSAHDAADGSGRDADALLGRGWGDWCQDEPVTPALRAAREAFGDTAVVVNAHGTAADRLLLESAPFRALEGADLLARAVDADRAVVYAAEADERALERAREAAANYPEPETEFEVHAGPAVHRAAEPTMALEAVEGNHRLEARLRRPGELPTLDGRPALVHTARTVAHLAERVGAVVSDGGGDGAEGSGGARDAGSDGGGDAGRDDRPGTRLVTVSGDVAAPATVELPETDHLETALDAVSLDGAFKAAAVGGRFGGLTDSLDRSPAPDALAAADLGTEGGVEVLAEGRCVLEFVGRRARRAADTNCGRCVPCREGTTQLAELLRDVYDGDYDAAGIAELVRVIEGSSVCAFGVEAARPARTAMADFDAELRAHADGRCPAGTCFDPVEVPQ